MSEETDDEPQKILDILRRMEPHLQNYIEELRKPQQRGEAYPTTYYTVIGLFWRQFRELEGLSVQDLASRMDVDDMLLYAFESGMVSADQIKTLPRAYAGAMGKPTLYEKLYSEFLRRWNVPEHIYKPDNSSRPPTA